MKKLFYIGITIVILLSACSKKGDTPEPNGGGFAGNKAPGDIFIKQGTEGIKKFSLSTGVVSAIIPNWSNGSGWDISWDATKGVKQVDITSYDTRYIIFNINDGSTIKEILYEPTDNHGGLPVISPDGKLLALRPEFDDGLVILDMGGNVLRNILGYGPAHEFEYLAPLCWEATGTILFKKDGGLWRTSTDFNRASKVRDIPFDDWKGHATASPDGKKIAISAGNHIWLMNADGSNFHQVTQSDQKEIAPCFSPDSKYIAMKANSRAGEPGEGTTAFHLCIIPADGKVYKVWPGEDDRVIHPFTKDAVDSRGLGITIVGDFLWR